ncbi:helicase associated domain-containing protein [Streptomyces sp. NBC_01005]|uniref:helicase associated domain-containing protein n=1 Tax=unclassified Streptomyces TaxID=2593676 RepID=UPI002E2F4209|nr:helicase associated domain-containing protein [Streptomyces sp. NBC_01362]WSW02960.1 helicase associated domain-containing protein [Streptomyces sp. NBC_01005]
MWEGHPIGVRAENARAAVRRARENEELRAAGLPVPSAAGAMTEARRDELDAIDPGWCPVWDTGWQRCFRLVQIHVQAGGTLPEAAGDVVVQGEDLGRWVTAQRYGWGQLLPVQRWILENTLKVAPAGEDERPVKQTQDAKWAANLAAARQFHAREGHLRVPGSTSRSWMRARPRQGGTGGHVVVKLGTWLDNVRKRAAKLLSSAVRISISSACAGRQPRAGREGRACGYPPMSALMLGIIRVMPTYVPSPDEVTAAQTPDGGWTRKQLAEWGVPWPPPQGWRKHLKAKWEGKDVPPLQRQEPDQDSLF